LDEPVEDKYYDQDDGTLRCPKCFSKDIVPSLLSGWLDNAMWHLQRIPRQCRYCGKRFYIKDPQK
jgi:hypothetical protein